MSRWGPLVSNGSIVWPRVVLVAIAAALVLAVGVAAATSGAVFNPYNPQWDGTSEFRSDAAVQPITSTAGLESLEPTESTLLVLGPPADPETDGLATFVAEGGTLVVLENFGTGGNAVLEAAGANARVTGWLLRDEQHYTEGPNMPVAPLVADHELTHGVEQLSLNYASAVEPGGATVLVASSEVSYLVPDATADVDTEATAPAAVPVATVESIGDGRVVTVGDPSIAINVMYGEPDNRAFLLGLADDRAVYADLRGGAGVPPLVGATLAVQSAPWLQAVLALVGIGAIAAVPVVRRRWSRETEQPPTPATEEMVAAVCERHPEWDPNTVDRVMTAFNRSREQRSDR